MVLPLFPAGVTRSSGCRSCLAVRNFQGSPAPPPGWLTMCRQRDGCLSKASMYCTSSVNFPNASFFVLPLPGQNGGLALRNYVPARIQGSTGVSRRRANISSGKRTRCQCQSHNYRIAVLHHSLALRWGEREGHGKPGFGGRCGFVAQTSRNPLGDSGQLTSPLNLSSLSRKWPLLLAHGGAIRIHQSQRLSILLETTLGRCEANYTKDPKIKYNYLVCKWSQINSITKIAKRLKTLLVCLAL